MTKLSYIENLIEFDTLLRVERIQCQYHDIDFVSSDGVRIIAFVQV